MIIIAHRGNLHGPKSCQENSPVAIDAAIALGFDVEVDLRIRDGAYGLGHDAIEHIVTREYLSSRCDSLWIHAKEPSALLACLHDMHCFAHDQDDVVLTSRKYLWRYPRASIPALDRMICVLPEREAMTDVSALYGVCTDYPILATFAPKLFGLGVKLDSIYDEIDKRDRSAITFDAYIRESREVCWAVSSLFDPNAKIDHLLQGLRESSTHCVLPYAHFTWQRESDFDLDPPKPLDVKVPAADGFAICFHRVVVLPKSIALVGYPNFDVLAWRKRASDNIVHATVLRFTHLPECHEIDAILASVRRLLPIRVTLQPPTLAKWTWIQRVE